MDVILSTLHGTSDSRNMSMDMMSVPDFLREAWDDYNSPTTSNFVSHLSQCRSTTAMLEETLDDDRSGMTKMKKAVKALYSSGNVHVANEIYLSNHLESLGTLHPDADIKIGSAFGKFSIITSELAGLMKTLMQNLHNIVMFPLDLFVKGDLHGSKGDLKKPFDKAAKEYDAKFSKIEKEKKQQAKEIGCIRNEVSGAEVAEVLEKERRNFQLQMCEYLIKVNEIRTKKGVDLLQHFVDYYQAQHNFFQDGLKTIEHYRCYIEDLVVQLSQLKQKQDAERRQLVELRDQLKNFMASYKETAPTASVYSLHQLQGNKEHGSEKSGYMLKRSEGRMRRVWQRRRCVVREGMLSIGHSDVNKEPVKLNLLTCQVKPVFDDLTKKCFDLISSKGIGLDYEINVTDNEGGHLSQVQYRWISVLNNAKELVLMKAFGDAGDKESSPYNKNLKELTKIIIQQIQRRPGNQFCCDCGAADPEWLSVNLGVLICLECCGVHRDMGVHISRTQSIVIDDLGTAQLLLARTVSNMEFNEIMEATLPHDGKPSPTSSMDEKKAFIRCKYEKRRYAIITCANLEDRRQDLKQAIIARDIFALIQVYAEGIDFMDPLPDMPNEETALHLAISQEDGSSLYMVDFIVQNTNSQKLSQKSKDGNTPLHVCAEHDKPECIKLLLRCSPDLVNVENNIGRTALEIAKSKNHELCVDLLNHAIAGKKEMFEHVNVDWGFVLQDDPIHDGVDYSDDELDTPKHRSRSSRPGSLVMTSDNIVDHVQKRSNTTECLKNVSLSGQLPLSIAPSTAQKPKKPTALRPSSILAGAQPHASAARRKAPAPPPPVGGSSSLHSSHVRNPSDPGFTQGFRGHLRSPSDPPPIPVKSGSLKGSLPGSKMVLPPVPPPKTKSYDESSLTEIPAKSSSTALTDGCEVSQLADRSLSTNGTSDSLISRVPPVPMTTTLPSAAAANLPSPDGGNSRRLCVATYDCEADNEDELSFQAGELISIISQEEDEWWEGEIVADPSRRGMFPATYVAFK